MDHFAPQVSELQRQLPKGVVVTASDVVASYRQDRCDLVPPGQPVCLVRPRDTDSVVTTMRWATRHGIPVVPRGAGSGLSGGATAIDGAIVLSLDRMTNIGPVDTSSRTIVVEPGAITADIDRCARAAGLFYAPDPGSFEFSTIGGNLATNAGGMRCVKYGVTKDSVLALDVVLADGRLAHTGGLTVKDVAGLDLTSLFVGSEGSLGVITGATLRLQPLPRGPVATFVATFSQVRLAGDAVATILDEGITPSTLELMDRATINAVEDHREMGLDRTAGALLIGQADGGDAEQLAERMAQIATRAGAGFTYSTTDALEAEGLIAARRLAGVATMEQGPTIIEDVGVPPHRLSDILTYIEELARESGLTIATVAHAGDGNLHPVFMLPDLDDSTRDKALDVADRLCRKAVSLGGTITGEHGVGQLKQRWLAGQLDPVAREVGLSIKRALDPGNLLNPGRSL